MPFSRLKLRCAKTVSLLSSVLFSALSCSTSMISCSVKGKGMFLYSAASSSWDCSKRFTLHPPAVLFIPMPSRPLWEAFSHAAITTQRLFLFIYPPLSIARYPFIQLSELRQCGVNETTPETKRLRVHLPSGPLSWMAILLNCISLETAARGFETGFPRLRVQCSDHCATASDNN